METEPTKIENYADEKVAAIYEKYKGTFDKLQDLYEKAQQNITSTKNIEENLAGVEYNEKLEPLAYLFYMVDSKGQIKPTLSREDIIDEIREDNRPRFRVGQPEGHSHDLTVEVLGDDGDRYEFKSEKGIWKLAS